jgi:hypothetical protein
MSGKGLESITVLNLAGAPLAEWQLVPARGPDENLHLTPILPAHTMRKLTKNVTS